MVLELWPLLRWAGVEAAVATECREVDSRHVVAFALPDQSLKVRFVPEAL